MDTFAAVDDPLHTGGKRWAEMALALLPAQRSATSMLGQTLHGHPWGK